MANVAVGDVLQLTYNGLCDGQTILNTFKFQATTVTGSPTQTAFAAEVWTKISAATLHKVKFLACLPPSYLLVSTWIQFISTIRYRKSVIAEGSNGTYAFDCNTANSSCVISRFGPNASKRNRGSVHLVNPNMDTGQGSGIISTGLNSALGAFALEVDLAYTLATLGTITPVLLGAGLESSNAIPIIGTVVQQTVRVMRRRTVGVGK